MAQCSGTFTAEVMTSKSGLHFVHRDLDGFGCPFLETMVFIKPHQMLSHGSVARS